MEVEALPPPEAPNDDPDEESWDSDLSVQGNVDPADAFLGFSPPSSPLKQEVYEETQKLSEAKLLIDVSVKIETKESEFPRAVDLGKPEEMIGNNSADNDSHIVPVISKAYLLPFEKGWKRELNFYENSGNVVYIHPLGLRLRSPDDLAQHLTDGLSIDNFSFNLEPIHAGPEHETITKDDPEKRLPAEMKDLSMIPTVRKSGRVPVPSSNYKIVERLEEQSRKRVADPPIVGVKREKLVLKIKPIKLANSSSNGKAVKVNGSGQFQNASKPFRKSTPAVDSLVRTPTDVPTVAAVTKPIRIRAQFRKKNVVPRKKNANVEGQPYGSNRMEDITNWTAEKSGDEEPRRICTMACPKAMGVIPTLQCCLCLCLYHPECAEVGRTGSFRQIHGYICKSCRNKPDVRKPSMSTETTSPAPPVTQPTPKPSVPQHIVSYEGLRFVIVPNLGVTPAAATAGPALPPVLPAPAPETLTNLPLEDTAAKKTVLKQEVLPDMANLIGHVCSGYTALLNVFKYLSTKDLLRAARVCRLWKDLSKNPTLWKSVQIKNDIITDWRAFATALAQQGTKHLDLRKLLDAANVEWENGYQELCRIPNLEEIRLPRVSIDTVCGLLKHLPGLRVCSGQVRRGIPTAEGLNIFTRKHKLEALQIKCQDAEPFPLTGLDLSPLASTLTSLSLLSFTNWASVNTSSLASLTCLLQLELGDCSTLPPSFGNVLESLTQLERVRFENGTGMCPIIGLIAALGTLPHLRQLELINFDGQPGLDQVLGGLKNIHSFLLIPSFVTQAGTNISSVLKGIYQLRETLKEFLWVFTLEFLQVTELYIDKIKTKSSGGSGGNVPILMPLPVPEHEKDNKYWINLCERYTSGNFAVVPMSELEEMLASALPTTTTRIFKLPAHSTSRQTISDLIHSP